MNYQRKKRLFLDLRNCYWDEPLLFKRCVNRTFRRCITKEDFETMSNRCHASAYGGHTSTDKIMAKILEDDLYWAKVFKDMYSFIKRCGRCQHTINISKMNDMPLNNILEVGIFDILGIDFIVYLRNFLIDCLA